MHQNHNVSPNATNFTVRHWKMHHPHNLSFFTERGVWVRGRGKMVLYLNFSWLASLFWLKEGLDAKVALSHSETKPKMQLSMRAETGARHDALRAGWLWEDFDSHPGREVIFPPFFSSCLMIKSQMSDTARHPKSAHCINISHRWQLCIKTTCS